MPIVCGTALSGRSTDALAATAAMASRLGEREVRLVHVLAAEGADAAARSAARAEMEQEAAFLRANTTAAVVCEVLVGEVTGALLTCCEGLQASLLIVSSEGYRDAPLLKLGGASERLAQSTRIPLLIVRDAAPMTAWARQDEPLRVVLGVDWARSADQAIRWTSRIREAGRCDVVVAHVYYPDEAHRRYGVTEPLAPFQPNPRVEQLLEGDLEARVGRVAGTGSLSFRAKLAIGRKGDHLLALAEAERADVIVLGTHHHRGLARLASVASVAIRFGRASVAVIPGEP